MYQYDMLARSLASGNGYRWYAPADVAYLAPYMHLDPAKLTLDPRGILTTFRAPLYPMFLSLIYMLNGINPGRFFAARLAQTFLGASLVPLTYWTALRIPFTSIVSSKMTPEASHERTARLAAWIVSCYPMLLLFPLALATENLFFVLVLASILGLLQLGRVSSAALIVFYSIVCGLLLGLAALTRSVILPFAGLALLWIWFSLGQRRAAILAFVSLLLVVTPWVIRNSLVSHRLTGIETSMGYNLYLGYHPLSTGTFIYGPSLNLLTILDDAQRDRIGTQDALAFIREDPSRFPYLAVRRLGYFFNLEIRAFTYFYVNDFLGFIPFAVLAVILLVLALPFVALSLSAAMGWAVLPGSRESLLLLLLFVGYLLPHVFILSEERFHVILVPFFAILAAGFWTHGFSIFRSRPGWLVAVSALMMLLLLANWCFEIVRDGPTIAEMLGPYGNQLYLPY